VAAFISPAVTPRWSRVARRAAEVKIDCMTKSAAASDVASERRRPRQQFSSVRIATMWCLDGGSEVGGHVREAGVVPLERNGNGVGGTVAVLGNDEVGLAFAR